MAKIAWGKPRIFVLDADTPNADWYELPTPVEDSTQLSATKGDKLEAKIEGGENEDVKYKRSTYTLALNIRKAKDRKAPFPSLDGVVNNHYAIMLQPEDPTVEGFYIAATTVSIDETFTAAEGAMWVITMEALKAASGDTVKWGIVTKSGTTLTFTEGSSDETVNGTIADDTDITTSDVTPVSYTRVTNTTGKNPSTEGWFERSGTSPNYTYTLTTDTTPSSSKTYYKQTT